MATSAQIKDAYWKAVALRSIVNHYLNTLKKIEKEKADKQAAEKEPSKKKTDEKKSSEKKPDKKKTDEKKPSKKEPDKKKTVELKPAELKAKSLALAGQMTDKYGRWTACKHIVTSRLAAGDMATAKKAAALLSDPLFKAALLVDIAQAQIQRGDIDGAKETTGQTPQGMLRVWLYLDIARSQIKSAKPAEVAETLGLAKAAAAENESLYWPCRAFAEIGRAQFQAGNRGEANKALALTNIIAGRITDQTEKVLVKMWIVGPSAGKAQAAIIMSKTKIKEIEAWTQMAKRLFNKPVFRDQRAFALSIRGKEAKDIIRALTGGANQITKTLKDLQDKEQSGKQNNK